MTGKGRIKRILRLCHFEFFEKGEGDIKEFRQLVICSFGKGRIETQKEFRRPKKRRCEKLLIDSLSKIDWLNEPHSLSEATSLLRRCKILEKDKSEISALSA
ncbi:hypothetical protein HKD37_11G032047 [Glycine soja]